MIIVLITLGSAAAIVALYYLVKKVQDMKMAEFKIYEDEIARRAKLEEPITTTCLELYGFKIYDTKDKIYALHGNISMTRRKGGYWETEIQAPGTILWRDTHSTMGELLTFCEKHNYILIKTEE